MKENRHTDVSACVHCHNCRKHCLFLKKYRIDIGDTEKLRKLAYHCFQCGRCAQVCPQGIDGKEYILDIRREMGLQTGGAFWKKGYGMLLMEKQDYRFRNYRHASCESVLFPGCSFPSFYPKTLKKLVELLGKAAGIGVVYDCCGKPVAELGLCGQEERIVRRIDREMRARAIKEIILVCPNCYDFLKGKLSAKVVSVYEKLAELELGERIAGSGQVFIPCPDREGRDWLGRIGYFTQNPLHPMEQAQCCGLGGSGAVKEPKLAKRMAGEIEKGQCQKQAVYVYCASCGGNLSRNGRRISHVLSEILRVRESPDTGKSILNRAKTKFL